MKLEINGEVYELDRANMEYVMVNAMKGKIESIGREAGHLEFMVKSTINAVMSFMGRKHPELRKPDDMDTFEHASRAVVNMVLDQWERGSLKVTAKKVEANVPNQNQSV